jgi:hypothetical protein
VAVVVVVRTFQLVAVAVLVDIVPPPDTQSQLVLLLQ